MIKTRCNGELALLFLQKNGIYIVSARSNLSPQLKPFFFFDFLPWTVMQERQLYQKSTWSFMERIICHISCDNSGLSLMPLEIPFRLVLIYAFCRHCCCCLDRDLGSFQVQNLVKMPSAMAYVLYLKCRLTGVLKMYPAKLIVFHFSFSGIFHHWLIENTSVSIAFTPSRLSSFKNVPCRCSCQLVFPFSVSSKLSFHCG